MFVVQQGCVAWAAIGGSYGPVNIATLIKKVAHLVVTVAINCTCFAHNHLLRGGNPSTLVLHGALGLRSMRLILTGGNGGKLNRRQIINNRFLIERLP